jgi:DNA-binding transcriptional MerR regulator
MYFRGEEMLNKNREVNGIDEGWLQLILEAKELGLSVELVRAFLNRSRQVN